MKVDINSPASMPLAPSSTQAAGKDKVATSAATEDRVTLASNDALVRSLTAEAMETPQIRQDKVEQIRQTINNGSYNLDPQAIADAMIKSGE